ncbi:hypothetical protein SAMN05444672_103256 [Bacillus sp. OK838]|nr:hypothetical protein SAMN05444672_103256 [Bacillus sp. OK838]
MEFLVVNAQHMKAVLGRKTDGKDTEWIVQLLRHGLLKASFIPFEISENCVSLFVIAEVLLKNELVIQKDLDGANIKLGSVVSDIMGVSSKDMLHAIANGEDDPEKLANFARRSMKKKKDDEILRISEHSRDICIKHRELKSAV